MKKSSILIITLVLFSTVSTSIFSTSTIKWLTFEQAIDVAKKEKRKVIIDVYTDWCGWCKKMDATTFSHPKIVEYINKKYYAVKLNAESDKSFNFKGQKVTERQLASQFFKVTAYPTTVYLDENFDLISPVPGFWEAREYDKVIHFFGEDQFKKQTWDDFQKSYKSSF
jgi:thioredoxin-related protein